MSINKVILLGYTGKDPEVKDVAGTKVANLSLLSLIHISEPTRP